MMLTGFYVQQMPEAASGLQTSTNHNLLLESRVGVGQKLLKVGLEPGSSLRCRLESIRIAAVVIVPR